MKLYSLIKNLNCRVFGNTVIDITGLYHNDLLVKEGSLFFCLRGTKVDGSDFVKSAVRNGAVAIVAEQEIPYIYGVTQIIVKNAREAMSLIACKFYGNPAGKLKLIGVTGTNGKTTTTTMIANVLNWSGHKTALVGTNGIIIDSLKFDTGMTTPDPIELQKYFAMMVRKKIEFVCIEVSAHAIDLHKIDGLKFEVGVFTNLTEDHLDYFKTMQRYYQSKANFFTAKYIKSAIINIDDEYGLKLYDSINVPKFTYAITASADYVATNLKIFRGEQVFDIDKENFTLKILGKFNVYNALATYAVLKSLNIENLDIVNAFSNLKPVDGRFNIYEVKGRCYVVDYAHTPDGLKKILEACREFVGDNKLVCIFGCGGNREMQKRSIMGEISSKYADFSIITSDNPRFEKREDIIADVLKGIENENFTVIEDRKEAIKRSIELSNVGDVIVVAGKGSESYIDEAGVKIPYSDIEEIMKLGEIDEWFIFAD